MDVNKTIKERYWVLLVTCPSCWAILAIPVGNLDDASFECKHCWTLEDMHLFPDLFD